MLKRSNTVVKGKISRRDEVVSHDDVTWINMDTWVVCVNVQAIIIVLCISIDNNRIIQDH
jgi:hypothetical protein